MIALPLSLHVSMDALIAFLSEYGRFTAAEISLIKSRAEKITVPKHTKLAEASHFLKGLYFLKNGITRVYYFTEKGEEITKYFIDEGHFSTDGHSFFYQIPTTSYVETVTDCELIYISKADFDDFSARISGWTEVFLKIMAHGMHEKVNRISPMLAETGRERYLRFMERFPSLINKIPLNLLASYLGMTKSSLSRIRKTIP